MEQAQFSSISKYTTRYSVPNVNSSFARTTTHHRKKKSKHFRFLTFCFLFCFVFLPVRAHQSNTPRIQSQYPAMGSYPPAPPPPQQNQTQLGAAAAMQYSPYVIYALSQITLFASNEMVRRIQIDCQMTNAMDSRHFV